MPQTSPRIDHVVINVAANLDQAAAQYRRLGFQLTPRGHHSLGSSNHLAIFTNTYLELLGYEAPNKARAAAYWGELQGLAGLVFKTTDADALFAELAQRGVTLDGQAPQAFFRPVELPDGSAREARFRTVRLDPQAIVNGRIFFCQHLDPDLVWRSTWQSHANGAQEVVQTVIEARDPAASIKLLEHTFGAAQVSRIDGGWRLEAGSANVDYLTPEAVRARFGASTVSSPNDSDRKVALTLKTASLELTRTALRAAAVPFAEEQHGQLIIPADQAFGVALAFTE